MSTTRKIIIGVSALAVCLLIGAGSLLLFAGEDSKSGTATTASADGSRDAVVASSGTVIESTPNDSITTSSGGTSSDGTSSSSTNSAGQSSTGDATTSQGDAGAGSAASSSSGAGRSILPGTMPTITIDLLGPEITSAQCGTPDRSIVVYLNDPSGIRNVSLSYSDGPLTTRTVQLEQFVGGSYWVSSPRHTSPSLLTNLVVTAVDNRGNTTVKALKIVCNGV